MTQSDKPQQETTAHPAPERPFTDAQLEEMGFRRPGQKPGVCGDDYELRLS